MGFVSGQFTSSFTPAGGSAASIGQTRRGFEVMESLHSTPIKTDEGGESVQDAINMGSSVQVRVDWVEYAAVKAAMYAAHPQGSSRTNVGKLMSALSGQLVLTPLAGTPAAAATGAWTFYLCYVESDINFLLGSGLREGPITFRCLPDPAHTNLHYVAAAAA
jgi:hypothetical protein